MNESRFSILSWNVRGLGDVALLLITLLIIIIKLRKNKSILIVNYRNA